MYIIDIDMVIEIREALFIYQLQDEEKIRWHSRVHTHGSDEYELHYFIQGSGSFNSGKTTYTISPGSVFLCPPGEIHTIRTISAEKPLTYYAILFAPASGADRELLQLLEEHPRQSRYRQVGTNYRFFFEELKEKVASDSLPRRYSGIHQFVSFLYMLEEGPGAFHYGDGNNRHIEKALKIMQSRVSGKMDLSNLSEKVGLNHSYFIRLFRQKMKTTPMKYFTRLKIEAATGYLLGTSQPLYVIADKLGFYSEFHFSKTFKQYTGMSPRHYRDRYRQVEGM
jgi:AraC-like DNA-binding protein/mannose-6-phosphate isomerase-like protein (cupin superfamily)